MRQQQFVGFVEGGDVRVAGERDELRAGDLRGRARGVVMHLVCVTGTDQARHAPLAQVLRDRAFVVDRTPGGLERGRVVFSSVHVRSGSGKR